MRTSRWFLLGTLLAASSYCALMAGPISLSPATAEALRDKSPNANILLLREVQACRASNSDPYDCIELMLVAAERDSTYQSYDEKQEGLPTNSALAVEARKLLLERYPDGDLMIGLEERAPVDPEALMQLVRAGPNLLTTGEAGSGRLLNAIAQRLAEGGAPRLASKVLSPTINKPEELVEKEYGPDSLEAARVLNNVAAIAGRSYVIPEDLARLNKALAIRTRVLGADHIDTAVAVHNLAAMLGVEGKTAEAIRLARSAHGILLAKLGSADRRTATAALNLGKLLADDGDVAQGAAIMRGATADLARVAAGSSQLARAYLDLARADTALAPGDRMTLLRQATQTLEQDDGSAFLAPLRVALERGGGHASNGFGIGQDDPSAPELRAKEINLLESNLKYDRDQAKAVAYQRTAREMLDQKRYDEAIALARQAVSLAPYSHEAKVIPAYAAIMKQPPGQSVDVMARNDVQVMIAQYGQTGRALSSELVEAHMMLGIDGMKAYGPFGALGEFDKAAAIVQQRLTARSNFDAKARRDLELLRPIFRGQVMINFAAASQLPD